MNFANRLILNVFIKVYIILIHPKQDLNFGFLQEKQIFESVLNTFLMFKMYDDL